MAKAKNASETEAAAATVTNPPPTERAEVTQEKKVTETSSTTRVGPAVPPKKRNRMLVGGRFFCFLFVGLLLAALIVMVVLYCRKPWSTSAKSQSPQPQAVNDGSTAAAINNLIADNQKEKALDRAQDKENQEQFRKSMHTDLQGFSTTIASSVNSLGTKIDNANKTNASALQSIESAVSKITPAEKARVVAAGHQLIERPHLEKPAPSPQQIAIAPAPQPVPSSQNAEMVVNVLKIRPYHKVLGYFADVPASSYQVSPDGLTSFKPQGNTTDESTRFMVLKTDPFIKGSPDTKVFVTIVNPQTGNRTFGYCMRRTIFIGQSENGNSCCFFWCNGAWKCAEGVLDITQQPTWISDPAPLQNAQPLSHHDNDDRSQNNQERNDVRERLPDN